MENCKLRSNVATLGGGAAFFRNADAPEVNQTSFLNNVAFEGGAILLKNGAGLILRYGTARFLDSRFVDNVAHDGGAIFGIGGGTLKLSGVVFERNLAKRRG